MRKTLILGVISILSISMFVGCGKQENKEINTNKPKTEQQIIKDEKVNPIVDEAMTILRDSGQVSYTSVVEFKEDDMAMIDIQTKDPTGFKNNKTLQNKVNKIMNKEYKDVKWVIRDTGNVIHYEYITK